MKTEMKNGEVKTSAKKENCSIAKANGLKSTFKLAENTYYMTSFGKNNTADPEKNIVRMNVENIRNTFSATPISERIVDITGETKKTAQVVLPACSDNQLHAKDTIEQMYFGKTYTDNIHIQIAYNIMDMKKIFGVYSNNIIYSINNLLEEREGSDFLGVFYTENSYQAMNFADAIIKSKLLTKNSKYLNLDMNNVWFNKEVSELSSFRKYVYSRSYANKTSIAKKICICLQEDFHFFDYATVKKAADQFTLLKRIQRSNYFSDMLCDSAGNYQCKNAQILLSILGNLRQESFHENRSTSAWMFNLEKVLTPERKELLTALIDSRTNHINNHFIENSNKNLNAIFRLFPEKSQADLIVEYYDFSVRKAYKNLGFSVKLLREMLLKTQQELSPLNDKAYDSIRSKLYTMFDFVLYKLYVDNEEQIDQFVRKLRASTSNVEKETLYQQESERTWNEIRGQIIDNVIPFIDSIQKQENEDKLTKRIDQSIIDKAVPHFVNSRDLSYFAKVVYVVASFLDSKEINMFFDALINELENIASFNDVLEQLDMPLDYQEKYRFFERSREEAAGLRFIKSIAKMNKTRVAVKNDTKTVKLKQYCDAGAVLGEINTEKIKAAFGLGDKFNTEEARVDHTFRNFIINNVINSNRFNYVMRFMNPKSARRIMQCESLVAFSLKDIPDTQIERYCKSVNIPFDSANPNYAHMKEQLTYKLLQVQFCNFSKVSNSSHQAVEKERLKALVGLYLSVLYRIVKSIVRINTSYTIAFAAYERDCVILNRKMGKNLYGLKTDPMGITNDFMHMPTVAPSNPHNDFINETKLSKRVCALVNKNRTLCTNRTYQVYRNIIMHLNAVSAFPQYLEGLKVVHSYFDLYHYTVMMLLHRQNEKEKKRNEKEKKQNEKENNMILSTAALEKYDMVRKYQSANKDFIYAINSPLAYNAARYINLSCRTKFEEGFGK